MLWKDRIRSALLAVAVSAAATAAVVYFAPEKPEFTPTQLAEGVTYEATGVASDEIVASVDGNGAEAELFTFWLGVICDNLETAYGLDLAQSWSMEAGNGETIEDFVREDALTAIRQQLVLENLAERYHVELSAEDEAGLDALRENYLGQYGGEEGYQARLYKAGVSEKGYGRLSRADYLYQALYRSYCTPGSALYADDDVLRAYASDYITADHILLATIDLETGEALDEEAAAEKRRLAEELLRRLRDSADPAALFDELADEYSEDTGRAWNPKGYTFNQSSGFVDAFKDAAYALEENEYSDIVESQFGCHIILRRPLDAAAAVEAVREEYFQVFFAAELEGAELELSPAADRLDIPALYAALRTARGGNEAG